MKIRILNKAEDDLAAGYPFYESQEAGIGEYFLNTLYAEIDSLKLHAGIHTAAFGKFRMLSRVFPFGVYYTIRAVSLKFELCLI